MSERELTIIRDLAKRYVDVCARPVQQERRDLWRRHNSLRRTRPLIYTRAFAWGEMPQSECECEDPLYRHYESFFQYHLFRDTFDDDFRPRASRRPGASGAFHTSGPARKAATPASGTRPSSGRRTSRS